MYYIRRNSHFIKAAAAALSAVMLIGQPAYAVSASEAADENASSAASKEETVYVIADAAGNPNKIIVSDWLNNESNEAVIEDETNLSDIENLKGDEEFSETNDGELEWTADGNDIFYQGTADEELPVTVSVTYYLDGEEVSPEEIAGKSGDITIRYDYVNHKERDVEIDGETNTLHVPFTVVTGFLLDEDVMSDVQITNGRVLSDGEHTIGVGIAFPGISEDLENPAYASLTKLAKAEVPDYVEITGHTESFSWGTGYTLVTNELFTSSEADTTSFIDDVFGKLGGLKSGVGQIMDGVTSLNEGAGQLKEGADALAEGLGELTANNEALQDGAEQIFDGVLETVKDQLNAAGVPLTELNADNYETVLGLVAAAAQGEDKAKVEGAIDKLNSVKEFCEGVTAYTNGVQQAKDGADQLSDGTGELQAGVTKLLLGTGILNGAIPDLSGVPEALKESISLGEAYESYTGLAEGMSGKVRFIWKLEGIEG